VRGEEQIAMNPSAAADLRLRDMTPADLMAAHALSSEAQWPHRLEDWELMLSVGFGVVAELDGQIVGTTMGWPYGLDAATLGMVIVSRASRGGGIGRKLMDAVLARLGGRTVLLNSTEAGAPLYRKLGFEPVGTIHQHQGAAFSVPVARLRKGERVRPLGVSDAAAIIELDRRANGFQREGLVSALLESGQGVILDRGGEAAGFALFRRFGRGYALGPVVSPDRDGARALISHWLGSNAGMFIRVDTPGDSGLAAWLEKMGLKEVDCVTTMVLGPSPARGDGVAPYAIVSQAFS
jgi:predicted N-acetyltransferase YhbS